MTEKVRASATIGLDTGDAVTSAQKLAGALNSAAQAGDTVGTKTTAGAKQAEKGIKVLQNQLMRIKADYESAGDSATAAFTRAKYKTSGFDSVFGVDSKAFSGLDSYQRIVDALKQQSIQIKSAQNAQAELEKQVKSSQKAYENFGESVEAAISKVKSGIATSPASYYQELGSRKGFNDPYTSGRINYLAGLQSAQKSARDAQRITQQVESDTAAFVRNIQRATENVATANMNAAQYMEYKIQQAQASGKQLDMAKITPALNQYKEAISKAESANNKLNESMTKGGMSVRAYQAALRGVPAQITDIVVGLQGGQRPLTVLLQQGGQLKDMFGGVVPAVRALSSSLLSMINPVTVLATVIGTLGYAAYEGASEQEAFANAIVKSGNYAGTTSSEMLALADSIGKSTGKYSDAREAVEALVSTGQVAFDDINLAAQALVDGATVSGEKIDSLAEKIVAIEKDPVEALYKLNEQLNFLPAAIYKQVIALEKVGKTQEAARLGIQTFADTMASRSKDVIANAGYIEKAWWGVVNALKTAWEFLKSIGRDNSVANARMIVQRFREGGGDYENDEDYKKQLAIVQAAEKAEKATKANSAAIRSQRADIEKTHDAWKKYLKDRNKKPKKPRTKKAKTPPEMTEYQSLKDSIIQKTEAVKQELLYGDKLTDAEKLRIKIENNSVNSKKKLTEAHKQELLAMVNKYAALEKERNAKKFMADYDKRAANEKKKLIEKYEDEIAVIGMGKKSAEEFQQRTEILRKAQNRYNEALEKGVPKVDAQRILDDAKESVDLVQKYKALHDEKWNDPWGALTESLENYKDKMNDMGTQMRDLFNNTFSSMEDAFVQFTTTGKLSFSDLCKSILNDIAKMMAKKAVNGFLGFIMEIGGNAFNSWLGSKTSTSSIDSDFSGKGLGSLFNARALGGPVNSNQTYLVGEQGPELFVPSSSGRIIPNNQMNSAGMGGFNIQIAHTNEGTPQKVSSSGADFDGKSLIIKIVTQDIANDGMISRTMSKTFGVSRAAGAM